LNEYEEKLKEINQINEKTKIENDRKNVEIMIQEKLKRMEQEKAKKKRELEIKEKNEFQRKK